MPCLGGGDIIPSGSTGRFAGYYITAPPGMDIEIMGLATGYPSGAAIIGDTASASGLRFTASGIERVVDPDADADRINAALDQLIATLVRVPLATGECP